MSQTLSGCPGVGGGGLRMLTLLQTLDFASLTASHRRDTGQLGSMPKTHSFGPVLACPCSDSLPVLLEFPENVWGLGSGEGACDLG